MKRFLATVLLLCSSTALAEEPLIFRASAKVAVSAAGEVTGVEPDASLSPALQKLVRDEVSKYRFEPPMRAGKPVHGTTYVNLGGCAVPDGEDFRVSLAYKGAGPRLAGGTFVPPKYPERAYRMELEADAVVTYSVQPDGSARLEAVRYEQSGRSMETFDKTLRDWVATFRYEPEMLAGQPVATKLEVPVDFKLGWSDVRSDARRIEQQRLSSPECTAAASQEAQDQLEAVALDSLFKRLPSG